MVSLHVLAVAVLAFHQVVATAFPEPVIHYDLTEAEFRTKRSEYRKRSLESRAEAGVDNATVTESSAHLHKREKVGGEWPNDAAQQVVVEDISFTCTLRFGHAFRAVSGGCNAKRTERSMRFYCQKPSDNGQERRHTTDSCPLSYVCSVKQVWNYQGRSVRMPHCVHLTEINQPAGKDDSVPVYEGKQQLNVDLNALPQPEQGTSKETLDAFYELVTPYPGAAASFQYAAIWGSGKEFLSQSPKQASSWCCMGCPSGGTLRVQTRGFTAEAQGFTADPFLL